MRFQSFTLSMALLFVFLFSTSVMAGRSCSNGIQVCCSSGSASVSCSGSICKACCGSQCGCYTSTGNGCNSQTTPCVDLNNPDFATTNGQCEASSGLSGASSGGSAGGNSQLCASIKSGYLRKLLGC